MDDFSSTLKYLDTRKGTTAPVTTPDSSGQLVKYSVTKRARSVGKLNKQLVVPSQDVNRGWFSRKGLLLCQHNYQTDTEFIILNNPSVTSVMVYAFVYPFSYTAIVWVDDAGVTQRRTLEVSRRNSEVCAYPKLYARETIKPKFKIERYSFGLIGNVLFLPQPSMLSQLNYDISILTNPTYAGDTNREVLPLIETLGREQMDDFMPETLPLQYPDNCNWGI